MNPSIGASHYFFEVGGGGGGEVRECARRVRCVILFECRLPLSSASLYSHNQTAKQYKAFQFQSLSQIGIFLSRLLSHFSFCLFVCFFVSLCPVHSCVLQRKLNSSNAGWEELKTESDPWVLTRLLWSWLDHLSVSSRDSNTFTHSHSHTKGPFIFFDNMHFSICRPLFPFHFSGASDEPGGCWHHFRLRTGSHKCLQ